MTHFFRLVCRWLDCAFNVSVRDEERFIFHLKRQYVTTPFVVKFLILIKPNPSLEVSHLGAFAFINSRLPHSPPRSSLSTTSGERGQYSDSLFDSHTPSPAALQAGHNEESSNNHPTPVRLSGSEWDETETSERESSENSDGEAEDGERNHDEPAGLSVADGHNDEDDEAEADGIIKSESHDGKALSSSSRATTPHLNFPTPSPGPTPVPTPASAATPAPAPIPNHANATPPKRVQYKHKISHFTGRFKHLVDLDDNEPIPKFEYSLHQKGRLKTHVKVVPMERKHSDKDRGDESENENELE